MEGLLFSFTCPQLTIFYTLCIDYTLLEKPLLSPVSSSSGFVLEKMERDPLRKRVGPSWACGCDQRGQREQVSVSPALSVMAGGGVMVSGSSVNSPLA